MLEVLVAITVLAGVAAATAQLLWTTQQASEAARRLTVGSALAASKLEELREVGFDALTPSPPGTLDANVPGYCDLADANGRVTGDSVVVVSGTAYVRRWLVAPLPASPADSRFIQVRVLPAAAVRLGGRGIGEARLTMIRTRLVR